MTAEIIMLAQARRVPHATVSPQPAPTKRDRPRPTDSPSERRGRWREAEAAASFYGALRKLQFASSIGKRYGLAEASAMHAHVGDYFRILNEERRAVARCILTPAPSRREIEWKRAALRSDCLGEYLSEAKALAAIAADERWHEQNPCRRSRPRPSTAATPPLSTGAPG